MLTKCPWSPKGTSLWKGPKKVIKVLGAYSFLLDDKQIWHANQIEKCVRDSLAPGTVDRAGLSSPASSSSYASPPFYQNDKRDRGSAISRRLQLQQSLSRLRLQTSRC